MGETWDLAVVGGGAAGLMAGALAARAGLRTLVLEKRHCSQCLGNNEDFRNKTDPRKETVCGFTGKGIFIIKG